MTRCDPPSASRSCACLTSRGMSSRSESSDSRRSGSRSPPCPTISSTGRTHPRPWFESWTALTGLAGRDDDDPPGDGGHPDPAAESGALRPAGADPGPHLERAARDRTRDGPGRRPVVPDAGRPGLGAEGARRAARRVPRDRRRTPARRGDDVRGRLLSRRWSDHEPAAGPVAAAADHRRGARSR